MEPKPWVWPMRRQPGGGALARRGEGTFDSPSQSVPHAESPGLMRSGTWPALCTACTCQPPACHQGERCRWPRRSAPPRVPRAVDRVVTGAVLALVAGGVPEPIGGLPAASRALFSPRADSMYKPKRRCRAMVYGPLRGRGPIHHRPASKGYFGRAKVKERILVKSTGRSQQGPPRALAAEVLLPSI